MSTEIRALADHDLPQAVQVLCEGFPRRSAAYWQRGLDRMARLEPLPDTLRFGLGLFVGGAMRGVILAIPTRHVSAAGSQTVVNLSSWCVHPGHRGRAALQLYGQASSGPPDVTYTNLSATGHTLKAVAARGFRESSAGQMLAVGTRPSAGRKRFVPPAQAASAGLLPPVARMLVEHEAMGCLATCLETAGELLPLVFVKRRVKGLPLAQLVYCDSLAALARHGLAVQAWLTARGHPAMIIDASAPVPGLLGHYFAGKARKFVKGPATRVELDHSHSEMVLFGL